MNLELSKIIQILSVYLSVARKMKMKEKQKKRKAYEPKLTQEELMDSSTFKRFLTSIDNILDNLEDIDFTTMGKTPERTTELFGFHRSSAHSVLVHALFSSSSR